MLFLPLLQVQEGQVGEDGLHVRLAEQAVRREREAHQESEWPQYWNPQGPRWWAVCSDSLFGGSDRSERMTDSLVRMTGWVKVIEREASVE